MDIDSQVSKIYRHMKKNKRGITGIEALNNYGCFRLPARIADIEKKYRVTVCRVWCETTEEDGTKKRFKRYYLEV